MAAAAREVLAAQLDLEADRPPAVVREEDPALVHLVVLARPASSDDVVQRWFYFVKRESQNVIRAFYSDDQDARVMLPLAGSMTRGTLGRGRRAGPPRTRPSWAGSNVAPWHGQRRIPEPAS